jgi:hypothetical protein
MKGALNSINIYGSTNQRMTKQDMPSVVQLLISRINSLGLFILGFLCIYMAGSTIGSVTDTTMGTAYENYGFIVKVELGIIFVVIAVALLFYVVRS